MNRKVLLLLVVLLFSLSACSKDNPSPEERLSSYIELWNAAEFTKMFDEYLSVRTLDTFGKEAFIKRPEKLYKDLEIKNVAVTFDKPKEEKDYKKDALAVFPVQIKMDTIAGPVEFEKKMTLTYEKKEEVENWFIEWDPSFTLPDLAQQDKVGIAIVQSERGEILDRNGLPLAINGSGVDIGIIPEKFNIADKEKLATLLNVTPGYITDQLSQSWVQPSYFVPIKRIAHTEENNFDDVFGIEGVTNMQVEMREYPYAKSFAHLLGYIGPLNAEELEENKDKNYKETDFIGKRGLEQLLENRLRGEDGIQIYIEKTDENTEKIVIAEQPAKDGEEINLTIDAVLQRDAFEAMDGERGATSIIDPKSGDVLALTSSPAFDPNEFVVGISSKRYTELTEDPNEPLLNRFSATYAPGSSIKPITAAIGMELGTLMPNEGHVINGKSWQKDASWGNYKVTRVYNSANPVNLQKALVYSDNVYFAKEALKMGRDAFVDGLSGFGFGEDLPFSYPIKSSQVSNSGQLSSLGQLADTSFGQGEMLMNIVHLASSYSAILNDGTIFKPTLYNDESKSEIWKENLLSAENASVLRTDLREVVTGGHTEAANIPTLSISGKTGTAELKAAKGKTGKENGFFVAYPTDNPTYVIAMMIEGVEDKGGSSHVVKKVTNFMTK